MTKEQLKYCSAIMRNLKKHRDAAPFLNPVDYVKLNVPDYPSVITQPMNLLKVDEKLNNMEYKTVDDFIADVRLIFSNCFKYNGPEATISVLCQNVESAFEKGLRQMPSSFSNGGNSSVLGNSMAASLSAASSPTSVTSSSGGTGITNDIASIPVAMKSESSPSISKHSSPVPGGCYEVYKPISDDIGRPKREIHCPSKDYPETYTTQRRRMANNDKPLMKFCQQTIKELKKSKYRNIAYPFLQPVDPVALNIPDYPSIVKHPMDISTIEKKLQNEEYEDGETFEADVRLMFNNCYLYNPPHLPIYHMAKELEKVFNEKWAQRPITIIKSEEEEVKVVKTEQSPISMTDQQLSTEKKQRKRRQSKSNHIHDAAISDNAPNANTEIDPKDAKIALLERNLKEITEQIEYLKKAKKAEAEAVAASSESTTTTSTSRTAIGKRRGRKPGSKNKQPSKRRKSTENKTTSNKKNRMNDNDMEETASYAKEFTFEQKKELSESINELGGDDLNEVVGIIQASMPHLGEAGEEEITLDIDALDKETLQRLSDFVTLKVKPLESNTQKDLSSSESDDMGQHHSESSSSDSD
ncbi:Bromodomain-containing protein [Mycotypha africana]|uniref:Bromodomain-containing protein n=1 Tax=Mycotypha africana TaxID=64632 RepID=UPI002301B8D5|nr:Bromodomain-containing protein [Mycotypha africana]KAI8991787.1 Bromodomain-containing protein [Mycotypha africana]